MARQLKSGDARNEDSQVILRLKAMSEEAAHLASALAARPREPKSGTQAQLDGHSRSPEEVLKLLIQIRRARFRQFATSLFANPGWDVLLDLMAARFARRQVPVSSACVAAGVPATTALRWVNGLIDAGLIRRLRDPDDKRRVLVELTEDGQRRMDVYLRTIGRLIG